MRGSPLARLLVAVYVLLTAYASLYPLAGWRDPGVSALAFLAAGRPRYLSGFDLSANFLGYLPFGVLCALAIYPRLRGARAALLAAASGAALSLALEALQSYLPARIPSSLDVLANLAGALAGGLAGARFAPWLLEKSPLKRLRVAMFAPGTAADLGMIVVGLWLFAQLDPATLLFGSGDLRDLVAGVAGPAHGADLFVSIEAAVAATNLAALGLLVSATMNHGAPVRTMMLALLAAALAVKTLAFAILMRAEDVLAWLTPGAQAGLAAGLALMLVAVALPRTLRLALAAVLLMAATVLVNLAPPNPYLAAILKVWAHGHFLHFNGLTRLVSAAWPFAALGYLIFLASRRGRAEMLG